MQPPVDPQAPRTPTRVPRASGPADAETASANGCLTRLVWIFAGPMAALAYLLHLASSNTSFVSAQSLGFWALLGLLIAARYVDVTRYGGETTRGTTATLGDFKRYSVWLVLGGGAAWVAAVFV